MILQVLVLVGTYYALWLARSIKSPYVWSAVVFGILTASGLLAGTAASASVAGSGDIPA